MRHPPQPNVANGPSAAANKLHVLYSARIAQPRAPAPTGTDSHSMSYSRSLTMEPSSVPDAHPDAPNEAVEAAAIAWWNSESRFAPWGPEVTQDAIREKMRAVIQALVDGDHVVSGQRFGEVVHELELARAERDSAVAALRELYASVEPYGIADDGLGACSRYCLALHAAEAVFDNPVTPEADQ